MSYQVLNVDNHYMIRGVQIFPSHPVPRHFGTGNFRPENFRDETNRDGTKFLFGAGLDTRWGRPNPVPSRIQIYGYLYNSFRKIHVLNIPCIGVHDIFLGKM